MRVCFLLHLAKKYLYALKFFIYNTLVTSNTTYSVALLNSINVGAVYLSYATGTVSGGTGCKQRLHWSSGWTFGPLPT